MPANDSHSPSPRIADAFVACRERREMALIPYLTAGFPNMAGFADSLQTVAANGADAIEIGIPFCDPIADGPTIQRSTQVALAAGARLPGILDSLRELRRSGLRVPLVFMSYLNPLMALGIDRLLDSMIELEISGLIPVDLPVEESHDWDAATGRRSIDLVFLAAPTSSDARLREIGRRSRGFVYAVSRTGTTGAQRDLSAALPQFLSRLRSCTSLPIAVGFGISRPEHVRSLAGLADGVVVGSRMIEAISNGEDLASLTRSLKEATKC